MAVVNRRTILRNVCRSMGRDMKTTETGEFFNAHSRRFWGRMKHLIILSQEETSKRLLSYNRNAWSSSGPRRLLIETMVLEFLAWHENPVGVTFHIRNGGGI